MKFILSILALCVFTFSSCIYQKPHTISFNDFETKPKVKKILNKKIVYVHDGPRVYKLEVPEIKDSTVSGVAVAIESPEIIAEIKKPETRKEQKKHKYDINVYLKETDVSASSEISISDKNYSSLKKKITAKEIEKIQIYKVDEKESFSKTLLYVVLGFFIILMLCYLFVLLMIRASDEGSDDSNGSDSNSDSNSGDSSGNGTRRSGGNMYEKFLPR
jgi:hypothetical protein